MSLDVAAGWYASDDGLVYAVSGPHRKAPTDKRRFFMDYQAVAEIVAGDSIASQVITGGGLTLTNPAVNGTRLEVDADGGAVNTEYSITFTATTVLGSVIARVGLVRVGAL